MKSRSEHGWMDGQSANNSNFSKFENTLKINHQKKESQERF
jgi:hypothetical protein